MELIKSLKSIFFALTISGLAFRNLKISKSFDKLMYMSCGYRSLYVRSREYILH